MRDRADAIIDGYANDDSALARKITMKNGVHLHHVNTMLTTLLDAAGKADAAAPNNVDEDIISYVVRLFLIPSWEHMGFLAPGGSTVILSNEDRAHNAFRDFVTTHGGGVQTTELTHMQALDPVDKDIGSFPSGMSLGLRRACVQGAKEIVALEPQLALCIRNRLVIPTRY